MTAEPDGEKEQALRLAADWQQSRPDLGGLEPHLVNLDGYWWATFWPPGAGRPPLGGVLLLVDPGREALTAGSGSISLDQRIADYEASIRSR